MEQIWIDVRAVIKKKGFRQIQVARKMGMSKQTFSGLKNHSPKVRILERIAAVIDVKVRDFFI